MHKGDEISLLIYHAKWNSRTEIVSISSRNEEILTVDDVKSYYKDEVDWYGRVKRDEMFGFIILGVAMLFTIICRLLKFL